jgi:hypothetical protein
LAYLTAIWHILRLLGILCGHLVYFPRFGMLYQEKSGKPVYVPNMWDTACMHGRCIGVKQRQMDTVVPVTLNAEWRKQRTLFYVSGKCLHITMLITWSWSKSNA